MGRRYVYGGGKQNKKRNMSMKQTFQRWLLVFVLCAFTLTFAISFYIQTKQTRNNAVDLICLKVEDAKRQIGTNSGNLERITETNNSGVLVKARSLARILSENPEYTGDEESLAGLLPVLDVDEINIVDGNGLITATTNPLFLGYDMAESEQSREFLPILEDPELEVVQMPRSIGYSADIVMQYAGVAREDAPGLVQIGYVPQRLYEAMELADIRNLAPGFRIGTNGGILVCENGVIVSSINSELVGKTLDELGIQVSRLSGGQTAAFHVEGKKQICYADTLKDYTIIGMMPADEMYLNRNSMVVFLIVCNFILFSVVFALVSLLVSRVVIDGIYSVNGSLNRITEGNLEETVEVRTNNEFSMLSEGINTMVGALKSSIAEAEARIDQELEFARAIQTAALPAVMPKRQEFDLYASMRTAKEVGGDFYDFFFVDGDHLALVMADVSGKGIPAALFMMTGKTMIKDLAESGLAPEEVFTQANAGLCEGNDAGMFITAWLGILTISTGVLNYVNAGHNPPLLRRAGRGCGIGDDSGCDGRLDGGCGGFEYVRSRAGFVLAGMEGTRYRPQQMTLEPGDILFLYTDGVTEATDDSRELYGEERLKAVLDRNSDLKMEGLLGAVLTDVDHFVKEAPQFDDITMLGIHYHSGMEKRGEAGTAETPGKENPMEPEPDGIPGEDNPVEPDISSDMAQEMESLVLPADLAQMGHAAEFVEHVLAAGGCGEKIQNQMQIAVDELFSNICRYSGSAFAELRCGVAAGRARLTLIDGGTPYDPFTRPEPDVTSTAEERPIGGLGIMIVKKSMDYISYEYRDGKNILSIEKSLDTHTDKPYRERQKSRKKTGK